MGFYHFLASSTVARALLLAAFLLGADCRGFTYRNFEEDPPPADLILQNSRIAFGAVQVTLDVADGSLLTNLSGRTLYKRPFRLESKASFHTTFVLNISNKTNPGGEGLAFILTGDPHLPLNSSGQWLGIVNQTTNASVTAQIVAVEFDTRKSYPHDLDDNHVGLDVNSINSITQKSLSIKLSSGKDIRVQVEYDGGVLRGFVDNASRPVISEPIDLSKHLPEKIYVGFSASTGIEAELNCVKSWEFGGLDIYKIEEKRLIWVWITVPSLLFLLCAGFILGFLLCGSRKREINKGGVEADEDPALENNKFHG